MFDASDLRKGFKIQIEGQPYLITDFDFSKPGKGQAIYNCKLKNMLNGSTMSRSFRSNDRFEKPELIQKTLRFSYENAGHYIFQNEDFEEVNISEEATKGEPPKELPFVNVHRYLEKLKVRVPRILRYDEPAGMMVLEDLSAYTFAHLRHCTGAGEPLGGRA